MFVRLLKIYDNYYYVQDSSSSEFQDVFTGQIQKELDDSLGVKAGCILDLNTYDMYFVAEVKNTIADNALKRFVSNYEALKESYLQDQISGTSTLEDSTYPEKYQELLLELYTAIGVNVE